MFDLNDLDLVAVRLKYGAPRSKYINDWIDTLPMNFLKMYSYRDTEHSLPTLKYYAIQHSEIVLYKELAEYDRLSQSV